MQSGSSLKGSPITVKHDCIFDKSVFPLLLVHPRAPTEMEPYLLKVKFHNLTTFGLSILVRNRIQNFRTLVSTIWKKKISNPYERHQRFLFEQSDFGNVFMRKRYGGIFFRRNHTHSWLYSSSVICTTDVRSMPPPDNSGYTYKGNTYHK